MRAPPVAEALQLIRFRQFAPLVGDLEALPDSQVVDWQHVRPAKVENEEHFDRPAANSLYGCQLLDKLVVGEPGACMQGWDLAGEDHLRQFLDVGCLRPRKTGCPETDVVDAGDRTGAREPSVAKEVLESREDRFCRLPAQLLVDDCVNDGLKRTQAAWFQPERPDPVDDSGHDRVCSQGCRGQLAHARMVSKARPIGNGSIHIARDRFYSSFLGLSRLSIIIVYVGQR